MSIRSHLAPIQTFLLATLFGVVLPVVDCERFLAAACSTISNDTPPSDEKRYVLGLLRSRQFQQLESHYNILQKRYEQDHTLNDWQLLVQYQPFYDTTPENEALLTEWIFQFPDSYAARLARGIYYRKVGEQNRGCKWINETPAENIAQLSKYLDLATDDLLLSRSLAKKPIVSIVHLLNVTKHRDGDMGNRYWLDEANRIDPLNYGARRRYMRTLTPRWGGSYEEMYEFLQECRSQHVPAESIRIFEAIIHEDIANMLRHDRKPAEAFIHYRQALMFLRGIENEETVASLKGLIHSAKESNSLDRVSDEIDQYLRLTPHDPSVLSYRGWLQEKRGRTVEAMEDFRKAADQGHAWSQFRIGQALFYSSAPMQNKHQDALAWIRKSADQGYEPAVKLLRQIQSSSGSPTP